MGLCNGVLRECEQAWLCFGQDVAGDEAFEFGSHVLGVLSGDVVAECEADVSGAHAAWSGGERGEDLLRG